MHKTHNTVATRSDTAKYDKLPTVIKYLESLEEDEARILANSLPKKGFRKADIIEYLYNETQRIKEKTEKQA